MALAWHAAGGFGAGCIGRSSAGDFNFWHIDGGEHIFGTLAACQFSLFEQGEQTQAYALGTPPTMAASALGNGIRLAKVSTLPAIPAVGLSMRGSLRLRSPANSFHRFCPTTTKKPVTPWQCFCGRLAIPRISPSPSA